MFHLFHHGTYNRTLRVVLAMSEIKGNFLVSAFVYKTVQAPEIHLISLLPLFQQEVLMRVPT